MTRAVSVGRWAWAEIDLGAIAHNVTVMRETAAPASVWAVVKADGYGHGAERVARAALAAGAEGLAVALVEEGVALRRAGIEAPILLLSEQPPEHAGAIVEHHLIPTVYSARTVDALVGTGARGLGVHVKVDTGMQRVGARPAEVSAVLDAIEASAGAVTLAGVFTHLAVADEPSHGGSAEQLATFDALLAEIAGRVGEVPSVHAANSAAAMVVPAARRSFVRVGIAMYGVSPGPGVADVAARLRPALALKARVSHVKRVTAGSQVSYGWRHRFDRDTAVVTLPIGYADGVPRRLGTLPDRGGGDVLIGGRRCAIVGVVTMDQLMVDVGDAGVAIGDEAVLLGRQGDEQIRAEDWAERLGTIGYEVVCGISARVPRVVSGP